MKLYFCFASFCFTLCCFAQTWHSAYDSSIKYQLKQQYNKAIEWGNKALSLYEQQTILKDTNYSNLLNIQFENYYYSGLYKEAELYAKKDSIWAKQNEDIKRAAGSWNNLALLYKNQGRYSEAEPLYKKTINMAVQLFGKEDIKYASACNNLAALYRIQGRYSEAEDLFKQTLAIRISKLGKKHVDYITSCNNLALLYQLQGRYREAEVLYKEVMETSIEVMGKNHPNYALFCNNLALLYYNQERYSEAESLYKEALFVRIKVIGKNHPSYAQSCNNLAILYNKQGRYTEAESLLIEAKNVDGMLLGKEHLIYANDCNNLAFLYQKQKRYYEAETLHKEAITIISKIFGKEHPLYTSCSVNLARLYDLQEEYNKAEPLYKETITTKFIEIQQNFKNLSETEKEQYLKVNVESYFNSFQLFVQKRYKTSPVFAEFSYNLIIETKGLILESTEKVKNRILNSKDETLKKMYLEWKQTKDKYAKALNLTIEQRKQKKINIDSLHKQANDFEKQLALKSEDFAHTFAPKLITWKDIQSTLKKNQAAIEIVRINAVKEKKDSIIYMALIIKKNNQFPEVVVLPNGNELENQYLINYRRSITVKLQDKESYNVFWKPIKEKLKGVKTVYFSPDGVYHQINLSTLQNPESKKYIFDEIQIISVTNTKDILEKSKFTSKNNYLIGNPKFNLEIDTKNNEKPIEQRNIENLSQLEGAEKEVKKSSLFLKNVTTIIGADATEETIKSIKNPHILHIATHGYFKRGQYQSSTQAMLNSGLLFAGVVDYDRMYIRPFDKEDGKLTAFEVMNMELDSTELVVLSACETGLGQASIEGIYGLQRAFKVAGAQTIIMSLWKVNDEATQLLMIKFYENWQKKGMDKRKAFETAQKDLREQFKEPYYWGAFVMIE